MSVSSQFRGGIKSIQRGVIDSSGAASTAATISAVNTAKSELRWLGNKTNASTPAAAIVNLVLTNSTTITVSTYTSPASLMLVSWELTEWY